MKTDVVVDVGNTRVKWGRCAAGRVTEVVALAPDDVPAWERQLAAWQLAGPQTWVVTGVHPARRTLLADWLGRRGERVLLLERAAQLSLRVQLEHPDRVGIDRLLDAVAVNSRRRQDCPAVIIDAGSAVTLDYVDEAGTFRGGAIFPGLQLMAKALNDHTALLPLVQVRQAAPPMGTSTPAAIQAGVFWVVLGGIEALLKQLRDQASCEMDVFLSGGDASVLAPHLPGQIVVWPEMTLEGARLAAEALPQSPS
jgi:type III pantothenate kinase